MMIDTGRLPPPAPRFEVVDRHTGDVVGRFANHRRALTRSDKLDLHHGAYRYAVRPIAVIATA